MDADDLPDLIGAIADLYASYDIGPLQAQIITADLLAEAMSKADDFDEAVFGAESQDALLADLKRTKRYH